MTFRDPFSGFTQVTKIYWIGVVAVSFAVNYILGALTSIGLVNFDPEVMIWISWMEKGGLCAFTLYLGFILVKLWYAAHDHRSPGFWGWAAISLTVLALLRTGYSCTSLLFPSFPVLPFVVELEMRELSKQLPQQIEEGLVLRRVHVRDRTIVYVFQLDEKIEEAAKPFFETSLTLDYSDNMETCRIMQGYFRGGILGIEHQYSYPMGTVSAHMSAADCLERIAQE